MTERMRSAAYHRPLPRAVRAIVLDALRLGPGETLPTNAHYLETAGASAGTVQRAVGALAEQEALTTTSHGPQGRRIDSLHVGRAWALADLGPVRLVLPPTGPTEIDALADLVTDQLSGAGVPHTVYHRRGGARRLDALAHGAVDVAVVSTGVLRATSHVLGPARMLGRGSYYAPDSLVSVVRIGDLPGPGARVAIDPDSPDHVLLTEASYPAGAGYRHVEHPFPDVPAAVGRREVDAGIWHRSPSPVPLDLAGLACLPLGAEALDIWTAISAAALVSSPVRPELRAVIGAVGREG